METACDAIIFMIILAPAFMAFFGGAMIFEAITSSETGDAIPSKHKKMP